jgi:gliding motility-associated lipoprotein GldD
MIKKTSYFLVTLLLLALVISCKDEVLPKPSSQLRLDYPVAKYAHFNNHCPFEFEMNEDAVIKEEKDCGFSIHYPKFYFCIINTA